MDILKLIKQRRTIRRYQDRPIPERIIRKIIEAGTWAPSAHNLQPWRFIILKNKRARTEFVKRIAKRQRKNLLTPAKILLESSLKIIKNAPVIVFIYNTCSFSKKTKRLGRIYEYPAYLSEIQSISAAIENTILAATYLGLGGCWLVFPLLIKDEINKYFKTKEDLLAILTLGYPAEKGKRSERKPIEETVKWVK